MFPTPIPNRTISVFATPRPLRVAVVLDANAATAVSDFEQTASYFGRLWGGRYNAIALSHGGDLQAGWRRVLQLVDADCIYSVSPLAEEAVDWINRTCCPAVFRNGDRITRRADERLNVFDMIRETPVTLSSLPSEIAARTSTLFTPKFFYIHGQIGEDPYKKFLAQNFGVLSDEVSIKDAFRGTDMIDCDMATTDPHVLFTTLAGFGASTRFTPDILSACHATSIAGTRMIYDNHFVIIVGDTVADLALFRAIKMFEGAQGGRRCAWIPSGLVDRADVISLIRTWIINSHWTGEHHKVAQIFSLSEAAPKLTELAAHLNTDWQLAAGVSQVPREDLGVASPSGFFMPASMRHGMPRNDSPATKVYQCGIVDGVGMLDIQVPAFLRKNKHELMMLDLEIPYLRNEPSKTLVRTGGQSVWQLPQRQGLASAFLPNTRWARIQHQGLPAGSFRGQDILAIQIPTPEVMFQCCIRNGFISEHDVEGIRVRRFWNWHPSDEGQFLAALVSLFGSPYSCGHALADPFWGPMLRELALGPGTVSDVTVPSMRRAFALFIEQEGPVNLQTEDGISKAVEFLAKHARASSRKLRGYQKQDIINAFVRFKREADQGHRYWAEAEWKSHELDHELNGYVESEILRMGIQHRCGDCRTVQWIPTDSVRSKIECWNL